MSLAVYPLSGGARARRRPAWTGWFLGACLLLAVPGLAATDYTLEVDGQPVAFTGAGPVVVSGQVLVPLRGILERIGATVQWSPQTKLVRAQRGTTTLELTVGQRSAVVNGRRVPCRCLRCSCAAR